MPYELQKPPLSKNIEQMSKRELRAYFEWFLENRRSRVSELESLITANGDFRWVADFTPRSLASLGDWMCQIEFEARVVRARDTPPALRKIVPTEFRLAARTLSIAADVGIYLGEVMISQHEDVHWTQSLESKRDADYGAPILDGFRGLPRNPSRPALNFIYDILSDKRIPDYLRETFAIWSDDVRSQ